MRPLPYCTVKPRERPSALERKRRGTAECGRAGSGMRPKWGGGQRKIWRESTLTVWEACNPLKSHKTAKELLRKAWRKEAEIWKSLRKSLQARPRSAAFARPADDGVTPSRRPSGCTPLSHARAPRRGYGSGAAGRSDSAG